MPAKSSISNVMLEDVMYGPANNEDCVSYASLDLALFFELLCICLAS